MSESARCFQSAKDECQVECVAIRADFSFILFLFAQVRAANILHCALRIFVSLLFFLSAIISISNFPKPIINDFKFSKTDHDQTFRNGSDQNQWTNRSGSGDADQISDQIRSV